jgi:hypothetical protein
MDEPDRPRQSGLQGADYLLATGGQRLPNGDIDYPVDPEALRLRYHWPIRPDPQVLFNDDWLPDTYKAAVLQQLDLFTKDLGACLNKNSVDAVREELRTAAFEALKRLAQQIRGLEHPPRDDTTGSRDTK